MRLPSIGECSSNCRCWRQVEGTLLPWGKHQHCKALMLPHLGVQTIQMRRLVMRTVRDEDTYVTHIRFPLSVLQCPEHALRQVAAKWQQGRVTPSSRSQLQPPTTQRFRLPKPCCPDLTLQRGHACGIRPARPQHRDSAQQPLPGRLSKRPSRAPALKDVTDRPTDPGILSTANRQCLPLAAPKFPARVTSHPQVELLGDALRDEDQVLASRKVATQAVSKVTTVDATEIFNQHNHVAIMHSLGSTHRPACTAYMDRTNPELIPFRPRPEFVKTG